MNRMDMDISFAQEAINRVKAELTDIVFERIAADKVLMADYMRQVSTHGWGTVNRAVGRIVKDEFKLSNLRRDGEPKSNLILSYTQFG